MAKCSVISARSRTPKALSGREAAIFSMCRTSRAGAGPRPRVSPALSISLTFAFSRARASSATSSASCSLSWRRAVTTTPDRRRSMVDGAVGLPGSRPGCGGRAGWCQHHSTNVTRVPERTAAGGRSASAQNLSHARQSVAYPVRVRSGRFASTCAVASWSSWARRASVAGSNGAGLAAVGGREALLVMTDSSAFVIFSTE
ncbi:hypothetical protein ASD48_39765 [Streptomyces sp. Root1310]|nr:hypothetical protein ASD48_39765 [Streptomyces sp. Root1310]